MTVLNKPSPLDGGPTFAFKHRVYRAVWCVVWFVFCSWTPPNMSSWRVFWLKAFGAKVGSRCDVRGSARIWYPANLMMLDRTILAERVDCYNVAEVRIGPDATISQGAYLCAASHNIHSASFELQARPIRIAANVWIATDAFVGPGVWVDTGAVLGARGVTLKDLDPWKVYVGNPAVAVKTRTNCQ